MKVRYKTARSEFTDQTAITEVKHALKLQNSDVSLDGSVVVGMDVPHARSLPSNHGISREEEICYQLITVTVCIPRKPGDIVSSDKTQRLSTS